MRRVKTPFGWRCQKADGKFTSCGRKKTARKSRSSRGTSGLCRTKAGRFARCRKGMKRA